MISCLKRITAHELLVGELRERIENARRITEGQKVVLDGIKHVHRFFQVLEQVCGAVDDVSQTSL